MTTIGITGHSSLSAPTLPLVADALHEALRPYAEDDLVGVTCLARGADQLFAQVVLDLGGAIDVVIPADDYATGIRDPDSRARFDALIARARHVHHMPYPKSGPDAYLAASKELIHRSDHIIAVWDGTPPDGKGGTADAVHYAKTLHRDITVVWPPNAQRV